MQHLKNYCISLIKTTYLMQHDDANFSIVAEQSWALFTQCI